MSITKNDKAIVMNRESLQYLANCIRLVHSLPDLLNDVLPSQTTTYSSYKVTELLNALNTDLQNYVNSAIGNLSHLKKEIASTVPTSDVANSANKIPRYNSSGHLVLPDGSEFWIA